MMERIPSLLGIAILFFSACSPKTSSQNIADYCAESPLSETIASTGEGLVFNPDPMSVSGDALLAPSSINLAEYSSAASLSRLSGKGVLSGQYVDVRDFLNCGMGYGALSEKNDFKYSYGDPRFQEVMSYHFTDDFRAFLDSNQSLESSDPISVIAHCMKSDNAFYVKLSNGERVVCLGDSVSTPGASYADDASVILHELQHASTTDHYSSTQFLNRFFYDEAGALNESLSDAVSLIYLSPRVNDSLDPRVFSRWALGAFGQPSVARSAQDCPEYDGQYENQCNAFPQFSADQGNISFIYPDGLGWPFAKNVSATGAIKQTFNSYSQQEQIHNTGIVMTGALYDAFVAIAENYGGWPTGVLTAQSLMISLIQEAIKHLPKPTALDPSPVNFLNYAQELINWAPSKGFTQQDQDDLRQALVRRGLSQVAQLGNNWAAVGPGLSFTPGIRIIDHPITIKDWFFMTGGDPDDVKNTVTTQNQRLSPGETVILWFDIQNNDPLTAASIKVTVRSENQLVTFPDETNYGWMGSRDLQIQYYKINGSNVVSQLSSANSNLHVPTANSYFKTNPFYSNRYTTGIWVQVSASASAGQNATFTVTADPANGPAETLQFSTVIQ